MKKEKCKIAAIVVFPVLVAAMLTGGCGT